MEPRKGWLLTKNGQTYEVPEPLLDEEIISWPFTLQELSPGQHTPMLSPSDFYRRHELVPGEAYIYINENLSLNGIPEAVIRQMLGPSAARRPTRFDLPLRDLASISDGIAERTMETRPQCVLIIPTGMWQDATPSSRTVFHNMCKIHRLTYRVEDTGIGPAYWDCTSSGALPSTG
jgi:hypothetical protein